MTNEETETAEDILQTIRRDRAERIEQLLETIKELNPESVVLDGLDNAIEGYDKDGRIIYSVYNIIETLMERDGMTYEEAVEFYDFNIEGAYMGEYTPIFLHHE
tara:strand:- start:138 stop:449 length:312 start_codon:yes stop_codon:yes gene_type:complete